MNEIFEKVSQEFKNELLISIVPFWEKFSIDKEYGGYFSCIDRNGTIFDTDKFMWMQGRELWCWSYLYRTITPKEEWLKMASHGAEYIRKFGQAPNGDYYFSLDRQGRPLVKPYNIFSDCFCAAGLAEFGKISKEPWAVENAIKTWYRIQERQSNPKGIWNKQISDNRSIHLMNMPMIQLWLSQVFNGLIEDNILVPIIADSIRSILTLHINKEKKAVFEKVLFDGSPVQGMDGRLLSPGHALETLWFMLKAINDDGYSILSLIGISKDEAILIITEAMLWTIQRGWDLMYGGIYYYLDYEGFPPEKLEWDMKLWWVHAEALCAFLLAFKTTRNVEFLDWFEKIQDWTWNHFRDVEFGEWFGYLHRDGSPALLLKGGKWKGMFHIPRALIECMKICN
ncbi:MAG: Cellobiose 2-epimerase [Spirochaetes bacterium ADurb.Bin110]|nr:MAG: Cellobiose 2-epimerase [Spirochaetes bacterium ADurb.Bin110]